MTNLDLTLHFFFQICIILLVCRIVGWFAGKLGQPQVVAEMIAGVMLGPSLFGMVAPEWQQYLFPWSSDQTARDSQSYLFPIAQLGLALYMFVVGMEFRTDMLNKHFRISLAVSALGMSVAFVLGCLLAWYFHSTTDFFAGSKSLTGAMLFLGASLCITAFPMLARIIEFKGLNRTLIGTVAIGSGAIDDTTAWCLLALVLAGMEGDFTHAFASIGGGLAFVATAILVIRPLLKRFERYFHDSTGKLSESGFVFGLCLMALGAWYTDRLHLHAVFGAFVMGTIIPRGVMHKAMIERMQPLTVALLLPLFFTYSGLNTKIGLLNTPYLWAMCGLVLIAAIVGKMSCGFAARWMGLSTREALGISTLMNTRGLMELIIANIGLQRGIISDELFTMLVIMAVTTTLMTSPLFDLLVDSKTRENIRGAVEV